ncbi:hypothetical protein ACMZ6Y_05740 [Streptococcus pluranimalium]
MIAFPVFSTISSPLSTIEYAPCLTVPYKASLCEGKKVSPTKFAVPRVSPLTAPATGPIGFPPEIAVPAFAPIFFQDVMIKELSGFFPII